MNYRYIMFWFRIIIVVNTEQFILSMLTIIISALSMLITSHFIVNLLSMLIANRYITILKPTEHAHYI